MRNFNFKKLFSLPAEQRRFTVSTFVTLVRIGLVPVIVTAMMAQRWGTAFIFFVIAALTDLVDGLVARYFDQHTFLGACLDPIADKILLLSCFFSLAFISSPLFAIPFWFVLIVLCKETVQIIGAVIIFVYKGQLIVKPTLLGKLNTVVQILFIIWLFACYFFRWVPVKTYYTMLGLLLSLTCLSFWQYSQIGYRQWQS